MTRASEIDGFGSPSHRAAGAASDERIDMQDFVVTEAPRQHAKTLVRTATLALALDFVARHVGPPSSRLVCGGPTRHRPRGRTPPPPCR